MRWDELFDDLSGQAAAALDLDLRTETDERARAERGRMSLLDRLATAGEQPIEVDLVDGERVHGRLAGVGDGWCLVESGRDEVLVPVRALARVRSDPLVLTGSLDVAMQRRLGLRPILRALVRRRVYVHLALAGGSRSGGTLDSVGADHVELAEHPCDRPRRAADVRVLSLVPFDAVLWLRYARS